MNNDDAVSEAVLLAEAETGISGWKRSTPLCCARGVSKLYRRWTEDEEKYIRDNYGRMNDGQMSRHLGRTETAVHLHREREMRLTAMSKDGGIMTAEQVANGIGLDSKSVHKLMDSGRMPCRRLPSVRTMRVIDCAVIVRWLLDSEHWAYFAPERVGSMHRAGKRGYGEVYDFAFWESARRLVLEACRRWDDRWLSTGEVVELLKVHPRRTVRRDAGDKLPGVRYVNRAIRKGNLKATRWGNWWVKKSDLPPRGKTINYSGEIVDLVCEKGVKA